MKLIFEKSLNNLTVKLISFFVLITSMPSFAVNNTDFLADEDHQFWFDINDLPTITLSFSQAQWDLLLTSTFSEREEVSGTFTLTKSGQDHSLNNIGIKLSGNTSFVLPVQNGDLVQANFTLDFDEFVDDQELRGVAAIKLKRFKDDTTYVHEPLTNQIMHNFGIFTTHSSTYARLNINVAGTNYYFGVYRVNEGVNRHEYLDKRFGEDNDGGFLWQGNNKDYGPAHFSRITGTWAGVADDDQASFEYKGKGSKFDEAHEQIVRLANNLTTLEGQAFQDYAEQHINLPLLLKGLAAESILGHWDGLWGNGNNYYIYIDESEVIHFAPFDTDNTLGTSLLVSDVGEQNPIHFAAEGRAPLFITKILAISEYKEELKGYLSDLVTLPNLLQENYAVAWINDVHRLIENDLINDTGDNQIIIDRPALWANQISYRIFDLDNGKNFYQTRADALATALELDEHVYQSVFYRGWSNNFRTTAMVESPDNIWSLLVHNAEGNLEVGDPRFIFDINGDESLVFGDNQADGIAEQSGNEITFADGLGTYRIEFNALTNEYTIEKLAVDLIPPVANAGDDIMILAGQTANFDASQTIDNDGNIVSYQWSNDLTGVQAERRYFSEGSFTVELTVTDNDGLTAYDTVTVTVNASTSSNTSPQTSSGGGSVSLLSLVIIFILKFGEILSRNKHCY